MKGPVKVWSSTVATLSGFLLLGLTVPRVLENPTDQLILKIGLWVVGLIAAAVTWVLVSAKVKRNPPAVAKDDEIDLTVSAARQRLATARGKAAARFGHLPVILIAGPSGAAKTTTIIRSGIEPELLAGEVYHGDAVTATPAVNVWFAQGNIVLEAAGKVVGDEKRWNRLIRYIQPSRMAAVLSRGQQAPRIAVVCFGCDDLLKPGASEAVPAAAQKLRARLAEVSRQLGIRLPVYVIFTKADRLPYFEDFLRNFTRPEVHDVLGATLPIPSAGNAGQYAERESRRLSDAFLKIFRALALRRTDVLARETQDPVRAAAYEFPREFRKITDLASRFLLELCRPSQLGVSPFLRGFYFTGVRPVFVHDVGAPMVEARVAAGASADATAVFDARAFQQQAVAPVAAGSRKVPEWVFLDRIFRDVLLRDSAAQGVTGGGTKVTLGRRVLIAVAINAFLFWAIALTVSFFSNGRLLRDTRVAIAEARTLAPAGPIPELSELQRLDRLRQQAQRLSQYQHAGNPLGLGWGLYQGNRVQPEVRRVYFDRFRELLWGRTHQLLVSQLRGLPLKPDSSSDYDRSFNALKAYLVTSNQFADSARAEFLAPALTDIWSAGMAVDSAARALAHDQFAFFAEELPHGGLSEEANGSIIQNAQQFLSGFKNDDQLYSIILRIARNDEPPYRWSGGVVRNDFVVNAEFTAAGWERAKNALSGIQDLLNRDTWVLGERAAPDADERIRLERALSARYAQDYRENWIMFLRAGSVGRFANLQDAAQKLNELKALNSPILKIIEDVSRNTADATLVGKAFGPVHMLAAPDSVGFTDAGGKYVSTLSGVQAAIRAAAADVNARSQASSTIQTATMTVTEIGMKFDTDGQAQVVGQALSDLLLSPISNANYVLDRAPAEEINAKGASFCAPFRNLAVKYPFNPGAREEASLEEVKAALAPGSGFYAKFYEENLSSLLSKSGTQYRALGGSQVNPDFVRYLNRLEQLSLAFFGPGSDEPEVSFLLRIDDTSIPDVTVRLAGSIVRFTSTNRSGRSITWTGSDELSELTARVQNQTVTYLTVPEGRWSMFRFFQAARFEPIATNTYRVTWSGRGQLPPLTAQIRMDGPNPFRREVLGSIGGCPPRIMR